ncbi:PREDICTED: uncharacterized protein LOC105361998 [Ceratosolen solmsi marchali]|uniref:Uncharacterized protein LOC105361998 n=1 Tax=Ceratosolen solmsi marchali TaxID=326594 RepID=A0AAJ7DV87_9HYME|nr:PREDICTED: uncharacterized protein LOC105361998 [Ceratosolen solmsi marchali]
MIRPRHSMTMYYQQVSVDLFNMVYTAIAYLALAGAAWLFLRLIQACFWLPSHMKRQNDVQQLLENKVESYERYVQECEEKEAAGEVKDDGDNRSLEDKQKDRRECLEMLKRELRRIRDGGDPYTCDFLLAGEGKKLLEELEEDEEEQKVEKAAGEKLNEDKIDNSIDDADLDLEPKKDK